MTLCNDWNPTNTPLFREPHAASTSTSQRRNHPHNNTHALIQRQQDTRRRIHPSPPSPHSTEGLNGTFLFLGDGRTAAITCAPQRRQQRTSRMNTTPTARSETCTESRQPAKRFPRKTVDAHTNTHSSSTTRHRMKHILRNALPLYGLTTLAIRHAIDDQSWRTPLPSTSHCTRNTDSNSTACRTEFSLPNNRRTHAQSESILSRLRWRNHGPPFQNEVHALLSPNSSNHHPILLLQLHDCIPLYNDFYSFKTNKERYDTTARINIAPTPSLQFLQHISHASTTQSKEESLSDPFLFRNRLISNHHHYHPKTT